MCFFRKKQLPFEEQPEDDVPPPESTDPSGIERPSPVGSIPQSVVERFADRIVIKQPGLKLIKNIADTNSMDPLFDSDHTLIVKGKDSFNVNALNKGDIIVYQSERGLIVHRIIQVGSDDQGIFYKCEGDNNNTPDPYIIRDINIKYLVAGIIYTEQAV